IFRICLPPVRAARHAVWEVEQNFMGSRSWGTRLRARLGLSSLIASPAVERGICYLKRRCYVWLLKCVTCVLQHMDPYSRYLVGRPMKWEVAIVLRRAANMIETNLTG